MCISYSIYSLLLVPSVVFLNSALLLVPHSQVLHHCMGFLLKYRSHCAPKTNFLFETFSKEAGSLLASAENIFIFQSLRCC